MANSDQTADFVDALRQLLNEGRHWTKHSDFAHELMKFDRLRGGKCGFTENIVTNIVSRRGKGANTRRLNAIRDFLAEKNISHNSETGRFDDSPSEARQLKRVYTGSYQLIYDLDKFDPIRTVGFLNTRVISLENSYLHHGGISGSFTSYGIENGFEEEVKSEGELVIDTGQINSDLMLLREGSYKRRVPPVNFLMRFISIGDRGALYGMGMGFQSEDTNTMAATRVLGLPMDILDVGKKPRIFRDDLGEGVYDLIVSYLHGKNRYDSNSTMNIGPDYLDNEGHRYDISVFLPALFALTLESQSGIET